MIKKCECGYIYETSWQSFPPHRRLRKEEGPWLDNVSTHEAEMQIVKTYLYNRMRSLKHQEGSKDIVQFIQQEIDHVRELAQ